MTNILPIPAQKSLWAMHRARFLIVISLVFIGLAGIALLALIPSFAALEANTLSPEEVSAQGSSVVESQKSMMCARSRKLVRKTAGQECQNGRANYEDLVIQPG